jgi:hypothetical protein
MAGQLLASAAMAAPTPPGLPTMLGATAGDHQATVTWIAPTGTITSYTIYAYGELAGKREFDNVQIQCTTTCTATVTGLINGTVYTLTVQALNGNVPGPESVHSNNVTPAGKPLKPNDIKAGGGNGAATVSWTAPDSNGSPITSYTIRAYGGAAGKKEFPGVQFQCGGVPPGSQCSATVSPLVNGTPYTLTVAAVNATGEGAESASSNSITVGAPDAPTNVQATPGGAQATVSWTAPNNNGSGITKYTVFCNPSCPGASGLVVLGNPPAATTTVGGLSNNSTYTFSVSATNARGTGPLSSSSNLVTVGTPDAPTNVQATAGDRQATVTWTPPSGNAGSVDSYTIRVYTGSTLTATLTGVTFTCSKTSCNATITNLTNGNTYAFTVTAHNAAAGNGPESAKSNAVTPAGLPFAPIIGVATGGNTQATVAWTAPDNNGSPITSYTIRVYSGGVVAVTMTGVTCATSSCSSTVMGLTNGTTYTFRVAAVNGVGEGSQSAESNQVKPAAGVPGAPTIGTAIPGNKQATVSWTAPSSDGGSPILSYTVQAYTGNTVSKAVPNITCSTTSCSTTVTDLTNGTAYTFTVIAVNAMGPSAESAPSNSVTPNALAPSAPTIGTAVAGNGSATVAWTAPPDNGIAITSYTVRAFVGTTESVKVTGVSCNTTNCSSTVNGLSNGTTYTFTVAGVNAVGEGAQSAPSNAVTPLGPPGPPTNLVATAGNASATISWSAPTSNGGSAVTQYTVTLTVAATSLVQQVPVTGSLQATFTGLTNGTTYGVSVVAINAVGQSAAARTSVTPFGSTATVPGAPAAVNATGGIQSATVTWSPPTASSVTSYTITAYIGSTSSVATTLVVAGYVTSATLTGLANGATYTFTVTAINAAGAGPESSRSNAVTLPNVPGAPTNVQATAGIGQATVSWIAPASNGNAITSYVITVQGTSSGETFSISVGGDKTSAIVNSLSSGKSYFFTVTAVNALGQSAPSAATGSITIPALPGPPLNLQVTVQNGTAQITWQPPSSDGGKPITSYQITVSDGTHAPTVLNSTSTGVTVNGLTNGVTYTVTVAAINTVGQGGSTSTAVTPSAAPSTSTPNAAPSLNLPGDQTVTYGKTLTFDVSGTDPDAGDHLTLSVAGLPSGLSFVDTGNGHGTVSGTMTAPAGSYAAVFTVDDGHGLSVSHPLTITVVPDKAVVTPADTNPAAVKVKKVTSSAGSITVKATIAASSSDSGGDITKAVPVTCTLRSVNSGAMYTKHATTNGAGGNALAASCKFRRIPVDVYRLRFEVGGQYYTGSATDFLAVYSPSRASVRASGTITRQGVSASFSISATFGKSGKMQGRLVYTEHRTTGDVTVKSTVVGGLVFKAHKAYFVGKATLDGGGEYTVVATVLSNSYRKGKDRFGIRLVANHQFVPDLSFSPADIDSGTAQVAQN